MISQRQKEVYSSQLLIIFWLKYTVRQYADAHELLWLVLAS